MLVPAIQSRMKQSTKSVGLRVIPGNIDALEAIAIRASQAEILIAVIPSMTTRNNVINVKS